MNLKLIATLAFIIVAIAAIATTIYSTNHPSCYEKACRPDWSGDCYCDNHQTIEHTQDGLVICHCKEGGK